MEVKQMLDAEFLEHCLGGPAAVLEAEIERAAEGVDLDDSAIGEAMTPIDPCGMFTIGDESGSEEDADGQDLEDMFDFDPAGLAKLMNDGANLDELTEHLQGSYAEALERRLGVDVKKDGENPTEDVCDDEQHQQMGDLETLMTPDQVTPLVSPKGAAAQGTQECIAGAQRALDDTCRREQDRSRRSLAIQQRPSAAHRGSAAMKAVEAFGRRSLAQAQGEDPEHVAALQGAVQSAVRRASNRHRRSVTKAVEVLEEVAESSEVPLEKWSEDQMDDKVELIQQAMEEAYKRHRRSIAAAVQSATEGKGNEPELASTEIQASQESTEESAELRIHNAVAAAYERQCSEEWWRTLMASRMQQHSGEGQWWPEQWSAGDNVNGNSQQWPEQWSPQQWSEQWSAPEAYQVFGEAQQWGSPYECCDGSQLATSHHEYGAAAVDSGCAWTLHHTHTTGVHQELYPQQTGQHWHESSNVSWHTDQSGQVWCETSGGYGPCAKETTWQNGPVAPWRLGSA